MENEMQISREQTRAGRAGWRDPVAAVPNTTRARATGIRFYRGRIIFYPILYDIGVHALFRPPCMQYFVLEIQHKNLEIPTAWAPSYFGWCRGQLVPLQ